MRSTALVLLFCASLLAPSCDDMPKPGGPLPKASANVVMPVPLAR